MGLINQYLSFFIKIIKAFGNDSRYIVRFYGEGADKIEEYVKNNNIKNVETKGAFSAEKTAEYLNETDLIFSAYGNTNLGVTDAIGVKESYGPPLRKPVISDNYGVWYELAKKYGFGYGIDKDKIEEEPDKIYEWYHNIDFNKFKNGCEKYNKEVEENNNRVLNLLFNDISTVG